MGAFEVELISSGIKLCRGYRLIRPAEAVLVETLYQDNL